MSVFYALIDVFSFRKGLAGIRGLSIYPQRLDTVFAGSDDNGTVGELSGSVCRKVISIFNAEIESDYS